MMRLRNRALNAVIAAGQALLPRPVWALVRDVHIFAGADPVAAGLHRFTSSNGSDLRYGTAHFVWPGHQTGLPIARRWPTIVLPVTATPNIVVHEYAHALDMMLGQRHSFPAVTIYAETNQQEAFADALSVTWAGREDWRLIAFNYPEIRHHIESFEAGLFTS